MSPWPYPAPADDGGADHLGLGARLPSINLQSTSGDRIDVSTLTGLSVVFVYPWTGRSGLPNPPGWDDIRGAHGSTPEAEGFRDLHADFMALGCRVFGLSTQDNAYQRELATRLALAYPVLSDADFRFADALRLPRFEAGGVAFLKRLTLVVRDGTILRMFYPVHPPNRHAGQVLAALRVEPLRLMARH